MAQAFDHSFLSLDPYGKLLHALLPKPPSTAGYTIGGVPLAILTLGASAARAAPADPRCDAAVRTVAELARASGIRAIAEFIETQELRTSMAVLGLEHGQSFAIGGPAPLSDDAPVLATSAPVRTG